MSRKEFRKFLNNVEARALPFGILILLVVVGFSSIFVLIPNTIVAGGDFDGWIYTKEITVSNELEGYQTLVNVTNSSGGDVDCGGNVKSDFSDLRFGAENDSSIPYWIERYESDDYAIVWVNNIWNESTLNMYYGNAGASDASNGSLVFPIYFDNWTADNTGDWTSDTDSGYAYYSVPCSGGYNTQLQYRFNITDWDVDVTSATYLFGIADIDASATATPENVTYAYFTAHPNDPDYRSNTDFGYRFRNENNDSNTDVRSDNLTDFQDEWYIGSMLFTSGYTNFSMLDANDRSVVVSTQNTDDIPESTDYDYILFRFNYGSGSRTFAHAGSDYLHTATHRPDTDIDFYIDWMFIGNYTSGTEPSFSFGAAQSGNGVTFYGLTSNRLTWAGEADDTVWCNSSGTGNETLDVNLTVVTTYNVTEVRVWIGDMNNTGSSAFINASNLTLYASSDNSSFGVPTHDPGNGNGVFTDGGCNITLNGSTWNAGTMGSDPFNISVNSSIYIRVKLVIPSGQTATTYYSVSSTAWKVYAKYVN